MKRNEVLSKFQNRKPVAIKLVYAEDPRSIYTIHSRNRCVSDIEREIFDTVMDSGKPIDDAEFVAIPLFKSGVSAKYDKLLHKFQDKPLNESRSSYDAKTIVAKKRLTDLIQGAITENADKEDEVSEKYIELLVDIAIHYDLDIN